MIPTTVIGIFQAEIAGECGSSSLQDVVTRGPLIHFAQTIYPSDKCAQSHPTRCKSRSEDATLLHLALPAPPCGSESPRELVKQTSLRNAEVLASWRQFGGRGVLPRWTEPVEGRALRLGERRVCEAGYEGMIGRTLGEEEEIAATGNRSRFSDARQVLRSRPPLKKEAVAASAFVGVGRLPSNRRAFLAIPPSRLVFDRRACLVFFLVSFVMTR
jgi:hypothetical protein